MSSSSSSDSGSGSIPCLRFWSTAAENFPDERYASRGHSERSFLSVAGSSINPPPERDSSIRRKRLCLLSSRGVRWLAGAESADGCVGLKASEAGASSPLESALSRCLRARADAAIDGRGWRIARGDSTSPPCCDRLGDGARGGRRPAELARTARSLAARAATRPSRPRVARRKPGVARREAMLSRSSVQSSSPRGVDCSEAAYLFEGPKSKEKRKFKRLEQWARPTKGSPK